MHVFCGSVRADLCPYDDVGFRTMHAIARNDSPTENRFSAASSRIDVVHRALPGALPVAWTPT
jgi:hypothetical protein